MIVSHCIILRMRNVSDKSCGEIQNAHFVFENFFPKILSFMRNVEKYGTAGQVTDNNKIWHVCFPCWITKAKETHSIYVILIAFPWQH
jgi:hypothetical protein